MRVLFPAVGYVALSRVSSLDNFLPPTAEEITFYQSLMHNFQTV